MQELQEAIDAFANELSLLCNSVEGECVKDDGEPKIMDLSRQLMGMVV